MKHKCDLRSLALGTVLGGVITVCLGAVEKKAGVATEYKVVREYPNAVTHPNFFESHANSLNKHAAEGWETVCSQLICSHDSEGMLMREIVLKRARK